MFSILRIFFIYKSKQIIQIMRNISRCLNSSLPKYFVMKLKNIFSTRSLQILIVLPDSGLNVQQMSVLLLNVEIML